jgi:hypothetical protein
MLEYQIAYGWFGPGAGAEPPNVQSLFVEATSPKEALAKARQRIQAEWTGDPTWRLETMVFAAFGDRQEIADLAEASICREGER